ncbi:DUF1254 domain-containing protein [Paraburkholderia sp. A2WS-5]|uniref:DUF1254 domain-containing protein n=1 Tax=unclassified Paraburkholderia TaxID=2615204 RepID=UPI003B7FCAE9
MLASDAYAFGFSLVDNYRILYSYFENRDDPEYKGPWNTIVNVGRVYTPKDTAIHTPNSDTPYSFLGADLRTEPLVLTMPPVEGGRYFSAQFIDLYTFNFAYAGTRTTGNGGARIMLAGPAWNGDTPDGIEKVFRCETELGLVMYRTQLYGPDDLEAVKEVQSGYTVQSLSQYLGRPAPPPAPPIVFAKPLSAQEERTSLEFFALLNFILRFCPTHPSERELLARFEKLGIGAGRTFDAKRLSPEERQAIGDGMADAWKAVAEVRRQYGSTVNVGDILGSREHLRNNYTYRMTATAAGIYGHSVEEAYYHGYLMDEAGKPYDTGKHRYMLRFEPGQLPPVDAFWSLTPYELPSQLLVDNPIGRYLVNSAMLPALKRDPDGAVTIYIQHERPAHDEESNWLPAPNGPLKIALRLYLPKSEVLSGTWKPPVLRFR